MHDQPVMTFKSHVSGKNADVEIYPDRVEWSFAKRMGRGSGSEMMPIRAISSVTTEKAGMSMTNVKLIASGNSVDLRVTKSMAADVKQTITALMLGSHPSQSAAPQAAPAPPSAPSMPPPPPAAPAPPAIPAGWHADPHSRAELRYWDGATWTEHVSTGGVAAVDPI